MAPTKNLADYKSRMRTCLSPTYKSATNEKREAANASTSPSSQTGTLYFEPAGISHLRRGVNDLPDIHPTMQMTHLRPDQLKLAQTKTDVP